MRGKLTYAGVKGVIYSSITLGILYMIRIGAKTQQFSSDTDIDIGVDKNTNKNN